MRRPSLPDLDLASFGRAALDGVRRTASEVGGAAAAVGDTVASTARDAVTGLASRAPLLPSLPTLPDMGVLVPDLDAAGAGLRTAANGVASGLRRGTDAVAARLPTVPVPDLDAIGRGAAAVRDAAMDLAARVPREREFYVDASVTTVAVGGVVATSTFACAMLVAPAIPLVAVLAPAACSILGAAAARRLVASGYRHWAGREVRADAARFGLALGSATGTAVGSFGAARYEAARVRARYRDFGGYSRHARALTRAELRPHRVQVQAFRSAGFDIDHVIPVKHGWNAGIEPRVIARFGNLQALPSSINRAIGSKGT